MPRWRPILYVGPKSWVRIYSSIQIVWQAQQQQQWRYVLAALIETIGHNAVANALGAFNQ